MSEEQTEIPQTPYKDGDVIVHNAAHDLQGLIRAAKEEYPPRDFLAYCAVIGGLMSMMSQDIISLFVPMLDKETNETISIPKEPAERILALIKEKRDAA